ncbi:hypothetical protein SO3561_05832 [Streptomyces olivochromogenes]|uniref:Uncharacterized protein n=1 Tax=Streptomyces olivochromogenes TaxID=1963 RepID=A0A250VJY0_STROL|nr:hypothetical protein SO3561_05832 [Streptomyces olivochromogenes]
MPGGTYGANRDSRSGGPAHVDRVYEYDVNRGSSDCEWDAGRDSFARHTLSRPFRHALRHRRPSLSAPTSRCAENIHQNRWKDRVSLISGDPSHSARNSGSRGALFGFRDHRRQCRIFRELHHRLRRRRPWAGQRSGYEPQPQERRCFGHQQDEWVLGTLGGMDQDHRPSRLAMVPASTTSAARPVRRADKAGGGRGQARRECSRVPIVAATVSAEPWAYDESIASYVIRA